MVFVGSNNGRGYVSRYPSAVDLGVLLCFSADDGHFLWQHSNEKLPTGRVHDWPLIGVCSTPWVEMSRLWYVNNRCEVICLDTEGFYDGTNNGPYRAEPNENRDEADVIWKLDLIGELGVSPRYMSHCNVIAVRNWLFVSTSQGWDKTKPDSALSSGPSFLCLDKRTGDVLWQDDSPGNRVLNGQWGSPVYGVLGGVPQVIFPGGDGWLYSFDPEGTPEGKSRLLWKFDCNPKDSKWILGAQGGRNNLLATPVLYGDRVYMAVGQDPEHGEGNGHLWCIDATRRGDVSPELVFNKADPDTSIAQKRFQACATERGDFVERNPNSAVVWHYNAQDRDGDGRIEFEEQMHRSLSTVVIKDDLLVATDFSGLVHCLDAKTGRQHWTYDLLASCWSSPVIFGDYVYIGDEDGDVALFRLSADPDIAIPGGGPVRENNMGNAVYTIPTAADGVLYITNHTQLFAIAEE
jgi:outer membrane protein assembly factor BamB